MKLVSHCHSKYSFDSAMELDEIYNAAVRDGVTTIILNDHDVCSITAGDIDSYAKKGLFFIRAIEFTSREGVHIIGIGPEIGSIQKPIGFYPADSLVQILCDKNFKIILPHPSHLTGVLGNLNVDETTAKTIIKRAHGVELENFRYGRTRTEHLDFIKSINPDVVYFIGSDAHRPGEVSAFINLYPGDSPCDESAIFESQPKHVYLRRRGKFYFAWKKVQKTHVYQSMISVLSAEQRKKIKGFLRAVK